MQAPPAPLLLLVACVLLPTSLPAYECLPSLLTLVVHPTRPRGRDSEQAFVYECQAVQSMVKGARFFRFRLTEHGLSGLLPRIPPPPLIKPPAPLSSPCSSPVSSSHPRAAYVEGKVPPRLRGIDWFGVLFRAL